MRWRRTDWVVVMVAGAAVMLTLIGPAGAAEPNKQEQARVLFEEARADNQAGRLRAAVVKLLRSYDLAPHEQFLVYAFEAADKLGDPVLIMQLVDRAERDGQALDEAVAMKQKYRDKAGKIVARCPNPCRVFVDGNELQAGEPSWITAGEHQVVFLLEDAKHDKQVRVSPGGMTLIEPELPPQVPALNGEPAPVAQPVMGAAAAPSGSGAALAPRAPVPEEPGGLSPAFFWTSLSLAALAGGGIIASGVDALAQRDAYIAGPTEDSFDHAERAETRTNVLVGLSAGLAGVTGVLALFTRWGPGGSLVAARLGPGYVGLALKL